MQERDFELYRLAVDQQMADSPHKSSLIRAINYKLMTLDQQEAGLNNRPCRESGVTDDAACFEPDRTECFDPTWNPPISETSRTAI